MCHFAFREATTETNGTNTKRCVSKVKLYHEIAQFFHNYLFKYAFAIKIVFMKNVFNCLLHVNMYKTVELSAHNWLGW